MSDTTTYTRTTDEGTDTMIVTINGDETQITYLTDGVQTAYDPSYGDGERLRQYLAGQVADGYVKQS